MGTKTKSKLPPGWTQLQAGDCARLECKRESFRAVVQRQPRSGWQARLEKSTGKKIAWEAVKVRARIKTQREALALADGWLTEVAGEAESA